MFSPVLKSKFVLYDANYSETSKRFPCPTPLSLFCVWSFVFTVFLFSKCVCVCICMLMCVCVSVWVCVYALICSHMCLRVYAPLVCICKFITFRHGRWCFRVRHGRWCFRVEGPMLFSVLILCVFNFFRNLWVSHSYLLIYRQNKGQSYLCCLI